MTIFVTSRVTMSVDIDVDLMTVPLHWNGAGDSFRPQNFGEAMSSKQNLLEKGTTRIWDYVLNDVFGNFVSTWPYFNNLYSGWPFQQPPDVTWSNFQRWPVSNAQSVCGRMGARVMKFEGAIHPFSWSKNRRWKAGRRNGKASTFGEQYSWVLLNTSFP